MRTPPWALPAEKLSQGVRRRRGAGGRRSVRRSPVLRKPKRLKGGREASPIRSGQVFSGATHDLRRVLPSTRAVVENIEEVRLALGKKSLAGFVRDVLDECLRARS